MGKTDNLLFPIYLSRLKEWLGTLQFQDVAFLGQPGENLLSLPIRSQGKRDFFDLELGNWNINDKDWEIENNSYDLIVCTRCAYFAKEPADFIINCHKILKPGGSIFVDWALGDHWRFENYKVGWVKDGEHEYAYAEDNFLWSAAWSDQWLDTDEVKNFERLIKNKGYDNLKEAVFREVPVILNLHALGSLFASLKGDTISFWEDMPQLYTPVALMDAKK